MIVPFNELFERLYEHREQAVQLFTFTEDGKVILKSRIDDTFAAIQYVLAKAYLFALDLADSCDVDLDELEEWLYASDPRSVVSELVFNEWVSRFLRIRSELIILGLGR